MNILAIATHKGGAGKTTTAYYLAKHLSRQHGQHVLLVDLDPQGNLSKLLGYGTPLSGYSAGDVLRGRETLVKVTRPGPGTINIVPADFRLEDTRAVLTSEPLGFNALRKALAQLPADRYDWVLIDTPPAADILVVNALVASTHVVTPADPEDHAIDGANRITEMLGWLTSELGRAPAWLGTVATKVNRQTIKHQINLGRLPQPVLGEIPLRQGMSAEIDISEAYRLVTEKVVEGVTG